MSTVAALSPADVMDEPLGGVIPSPVPLTRLFLDRARSRPDRVSTYSKIDGRWSGITWSETRQAVEEIALGLLELGVEKGDRIAISSGTRREWGQADMAILSLGCVTVGIYPTLTGAQARYLIEHSGAKVVFTEDAAQRIKIHEACADLPSPPVIVTFEARVDAPHVHTLDALRRMGAKRRRDNPDEIVRRVEENKTSDVVTYVYTSGTTGEPKGAMLTHANFHYVIHATTSLIDSSGEIALTFLPLAHSLQRYANYLALIADVEGYYAESLEKVRDNILEIRPTAFAAVPRVLEKIYQRVLAMGREKGGVRAEIFERSLAALHEAGRIRRAGEVPGLGLRLRARLADELVGAKIRDKMGGRVKYIGSGGAPLAREVHEFFEDIGIPILEGYGLTETSAPVCINTLTRRRIGTVGRPLPGTEVKIAPDGEILVKGPGIFAGYFKNEAATREAFDEEGWFKTGDVGVMSRDGFLTITDRKKDLIITAGGKNVAPQPLESELKRDPIVSQAVVIGDRRPYLTALIGIDPEMRAEIAARNGLPKDVDIARLAALPEVKGRIDRHVASVNAGHASFEQIKRWGVLPSEMTIDSGELTPTLKVKRRVVQERYAAQIDALYQGE